MKMFKEKRWGDIYLTIVMGAIFTFILGVFIYVNAPIDGGETPDACLKKHSVKTCFYLENH